MKRKATSLLAISSSNLLYGKDIFFLCYVIPFKIALFANMKNYFVLLERKLDF